jgi:hypothetical protein
MSAIEDLIAKGSASFRKLNAGLAGKRAPFAANAFAGPTGSPLLDSATKPMKNKGGIRQNSAGLNKTEQAFKDYIETCHNRVLAQAVTLKLANGVRYTVDFFCPCKRTMDDGDEVTDCYAYEVKGFMRDDAAVKLKVAASLYPWIKFHLVTRKKGQWQIQEVRP